MSEQSIYQKIFDALDIAILAETGVTLNWREAVELHGYIKSLEEAYVLEGNDYRAELARLNDIIARLKEDGEILCDIADNFGDDAIAVLKHRELMKELE